MIFHEGDRVRVNSVCKGHPSWIGRTGIVESYNGSITTSLGSYNCEMEPKEDYIGTYQVSVYWVQDEIELVESYEDQIIKRLGEDYL